MMQTRAALFIVVLGCSIGCAPLMKATGKKCVGEVESSEHVALGFRSQRTIGKTLNFCKGGATPQAVNAEIPDDNVRSMTVGYTHETNENGPMHWDGACNDMDRKEFVYSSVPVALSSESFADAKLCYYDTSKSNVAIVGVNENCPAGTIEQSSPVDDCSSL
jgi:hypothetical protein